MQIAGRVLFGLGGESLEVVITAVIGKWFNAGTLGFAIGLQLAIARLVRVCMRVCLVCLRVCLMVLLFIGLYLVGFGW